jgi:hypothetical protein
LKSVVWWIRFKFFFRLQNRSIRNSQNLVFCTFVGKKSLFSGLSVKIYNTFLKKRFPGVGSEPRYSQFHLFSHFHHFTTEPQRLPKYIILFEGTVTKHCFHEWNYFSFKISKQQFLLLIAVEIKISKSRLKLIDNIRQPSPGASVSLRVQPLGEI